MKLVETETTVTTLHLNASFACNIYGGPPIRMWTIVTTNERGTYTAGTPDQATRDVHVAAFAIIGAGGADVETITRGCKSIVDLKPKGTEDEH